MKLTLEKKTKIDESKTNILRIEGKQVVAKDNQYDLLPHIFTLRDKYSGCTELQFDDNIKRLLSRVCCGVKKDAKNRALLFKSSLHFIADDSGYSVCVGVGCLENGVCFCRVKTEKEAESLINAIKGAIDWIGV
ncbi:MAG: hypothetical protein JXA04_01375 [Gammaproteobacteria bacterium]|nr:hypothetical protein [Gammaproteobacteria bacterium]